MPTRASKWLDVGDLAPWFSAPVFGGRRDFSFASRGGQWSLLLLFGSAAQPACAEALRMIETQRALFDDVACSFLGVSIDPGDVRDRRIAPESTGLHFCLDVDRSVSAAFGAASGTSDGLTYHPHWLLIDPALRIAGRFRVEDGEAALAATAAALRAPPADLPAPVLVTPQILDPDFCARLIALFEADGGVPSGFMQQAGAEAVLAYDHARKRRRDYHIADPAVRQELLDCMIARLFPVITRAFGYEPRYVERTIVARYEADTGDHFAAHRDNTTTATAGRRFAVSINLNQDFEGGDLCFPEFGPRLYRPSLGGAVVFSCTLMHQATRVTRGKRYATLPFLNDTPTPSGPA